MLGKKYPYVLSQGDLVFPHYIRTRVPKTIFVTEDEKLVFELCIC